MTASGSNGLPAVTRSARQSWGVDGLSLGISLGGASTAAAWRHTLDWAGLAERLGLHSLWLPEMHFAPGVSSSPLVTLAALARHTTKLRLATTSLLLPIHHPLRIAHDVAALDHLSGGRVILGLGRGFRAPLFAAFGLDPSTKRDRFDRSLDLILASWAGERVELAGTPFDEVAAHTRDASVRPHQDPHPPLAVAAFGRKGLAQAARRALPYLASPVESFDLIRDNLAFHRQAMPAHAEVPEPVVPIMRTVFVSDDVRTTARVMAGLEGERRLPRAGAKLPAALSRAVDAPIEDRVVVGGVAEVTDRLAAYREQLGMNLLVVRPELAGAAREELEQSLVRLAGEIVPALA